MAKYDWKQLEKEYVLGNYKSVSAFLKDKGIKQNGSTKNRTKGWKSKKVLKEERKSTKIIEKTIEKESEIEADLNVRHLKLYDDFLNILEQSFKQPTQFYYLGMPDYDKLKKMIDILEKAQKGQRLAKGLDKESNNNVAQSLAEAIQEAYDKKVGDK